MTKTSDVRAISKSSVGSASAASSKRNTILPLNKIKSFNFEKSEGGSLFGQNLHRRLSRAFSLRDSFVKSGP